MFRFGWQTPTLPAAIIALSALNLKGINLTIPHKEKVLPYLDEISVEAGMIGAVNTVVTTGDGFTARIQTGGGLSKHCQSRLLLIKSNFYITNIYHIRVRIYSHTTY